MNRRLRKRNKMRSLLVIWLIMVLTITSIDGIGVGAAVAMADSNETTDDSVLLTNDTFESEFFYDSFEDYGEGSIPNGYYSVNSGDLAQTVVSSDYASEGKKALKIVDDDPDSIALIAKEFEPVESIIIEFDIYPVRSEVVSVINLNSGGVGSARTVFSIRVNGEGNLFYYDASARKQVDLAGKLAFNKWSKVKLEVDNSTGGAGELYINDEYIADIPNTSNFTTMDRVMFQGAGTPQVGEEFYIDELRMSYPKESQAPEDPEEPSVYFDSFEDYDVGLAPHGYYSVGSGDLAQTVVSSNYASKGTKSLKIVDDSSSSIALIAKEFDPVESIIVEFDIYPVRSEVVSVINLNSGGIESTKTVFSIRVNGEGNLFYFDASARRQIELAGKLDFNKWSKVRLEVDHSTGGAGELYINDVHIADIPNTSNFTTMDRLMFQGAGTPQVGEEFYIDALKITGPDIPEPIEPPSISPTPIFDTFESDIVGQVPENYVLIGSNSSSTQAVVSDVIAFESTKSLRLLSNINQTPASVVRTFDRSRSAKIKFHLYPISINGSSQFALLSEGNSDDDAVIQIKLNSDGSMDFFRNGAWYPLSKSGTVKFEEWNTITINVPYIEGKGVTYADIYVNNVYGGSARYNEFSPSIDRIRFTAQGSAAGDEFYIDNLIINEADAAMTIPMYEEADVAPYAPTILQSTKGYLQNDSNPEAGSVQNWGATGSLEIDVNRTSIAVDLGESQKVNAIRMWDTDGSARAKQEDYAVYYSNDNITYTAITGALFNSYTEEDSGKHVHLLEFSGITARYIKINTKYSDANATFILENLQNDIQVEQRAVREYMLPSTPGYKDSDVSPETGQLSIVQVGELDMYLDEDRRSIGVDLGIKSSVDAVELWGTDTNSRLESDNLFLYVSDDNKTYTEILDWTLSTRLEGDQRVIRLSFPSVAAKYIKVSTNIHDSNRTFLLNNIQTDIKAFSSEEVATHFEVFDPNRGGEGSFVALNDGSLLMSHNDFVGSSSDFGEAFFSGRKSYDGGYTWSEKFTLLPKDEGALNIMMSTLLRMENGDLGLIYLVKHDAEISNVYIRRSSDEGETWSERTKITTEPQGYTIMSSGNRVLRLPSGRILVPVMYAPRVNDVYGGDNTWSMVWYSDDDGYTWERSPGWVALPNAALEPTLALLDDGNIMMSLRTRLEGKIYKSISTDDGLSWSQPVDMGLTTPSSTNVVHTIPSTGDLMIIWNNVFSSTNNPRNPLTVAISKDNGTTWHLVRNIMEGKPGTGQGFPVVSFHGRKVIFQFYTSGISTTVRIFDIDTLYHSIDSTVSTADLEKAPTPQAVYDLQTGILSNVTQRMSYSIDGGNSWILTGGTAVYLNNTDLTEENGILVRDNGDISHAVSDIQQITVEEPSILAIQQLVKAYEENNQLQGPIVNQLNNRLSQAEHHYEKGSITQASKHMQDFMKHLNNQGMQKFIEKEAKTVLETEANNLIKHWSE